MWYHIPNCTEITFIDCQVKKILIRVYHLGCHYFKDFSVPTERQMIRILNQIDMCIKYDKPVYVHCWGGKGRTGTVVGCYLARHGFAAGNDVIEMIKELRKNTVDFSDPSPETKKQINMVINRKKNL